MRFVGLGGLLDWEGRCTLGQGCGQLGVGIGGMLFAEQTLLLLKRTTKWNISYIKYCRAFGMKTSDTPIIRMNVLDRNDTY
jgi:hypothetical protein